MLGDATLQSIEVVLGSRQIQHVLGGTHRALNATQRVAAQKILGSINSNQQLIGGRGETLTQGGGLCGNVVGTASHHQATVFLGAHTDAGGDRNGLVSHELQGAVNLQLLDVFRQVTASHALVDVLVTSQSIELFNPGLDVVPGHAFTRRDRLQVDFINVGLVGGDCFIRNVDALVLLSLHHGDPQLALQNNLVFGAPQTDKFVAGVSAG